MMLLFGFTAAAAVSVFLVGTVVLDTTQQGTAGNGAEQSMVDTATTVDAIVDGKRSTGEFSFANAGTVTPRVKHQSGHVNITHVEGDGNKSHVLNSTVGAVAYELDDTTFVYQAGGVWRKDGNSKARMVRPARVHYNRHTLTYPVINITGDVTAGSQGGTIHSGDRKRVYPGAGDPNPLINGSVVIEVNEPNYCTAWEQFFGEKTSGRLKEPCDGDGVMKAEFTVPFVLGNLNQGIYTGDFDGHNNDDIDDSTVNDTGYVAQTGDNIVAEKRDQCSGSYETLSGEIDSGGLHCTWELNDTVELNTTAASDKIEIYAKDGIDIDSSQLIKPTGDGDEVALFLDDDMKLRGNSQVGNESNVTQTHVFVSSNGTVTTNGDVEFYGLLYASDSTVDLQATGGDAVNFEGALVAETVDVQNANVAFEYESEFQEITPEYDLNDQPFYYLHVVEQDVRFES